MTATFEDSFPVHRVHKLCFWAVGLLLLGYTLGGRGFAHFGASPLFITEVILAFCLCLFLARPASGLFLGSRLNVALLAFFLWGLFCTLPYIEEYGVDALRDAALFGYGLFALMIGALMAQEAIVVAFLRLFDKVSTFVVIVLPLFIVLSRMLDNPNSDAMPLIALKTGDIAVHLAGVITFRLLGLSKLIYDEPPRRWFLTEPLFWASAVGCIMWAFVSRGGMLSFICAIMVMLALGRGRRRFLLGFAAVLAAVLFFLTVFGARIEQDRRNVSSSQILANAISIVTSDNSTDEFRALRSTVNWRLRWWSGIVDYVVFGDYFWTGKGYGINLADSDGFQTSDVVPLRSPHNVQMTILARSGVPGLALWAVLQIGFVRSLLRMIRRMRLEEAAGWDRVCIWILAFWAASLVNGTFDVYLEGPQGGVWFWCIFGFGLAVLSIGNRARFDIAASHPVET